MSGPETRRVFPVASPRFTLLVPGEIPPHTLLVFVDRIVRVPFTSEPHHLTIRENCHEFMNFIIGLVELHSHFILILIEI